MGGHRSDNFSPGFLLDRYRVEEILAECEGRAAVRAFDTHTGRPVVAKVIKYGRPPASSALAPTRQGRLAREVDAAARIGFHSHLVAVLDYARDADAHYLVLEHLPGGDLATALSGAPLRLAEALRIAADVADGLAAAHAAGVVHCRLAPQRIFLTGGGRAKVGGFGGAQIAGDAGSAAALSASLSPPDYRSPEQEVFLQPTTDQYSLGLILFEMLSGARHRTLPRAEAAARISAQPAAIAALLRRMLACDADDRFGAMGDVAAAIAPLLDYGTKRSGPGPRLAAGGGTGPPSDGAAVRGAPPDADARTEASVRLHRAWAGDRGGGSAERPAAAGMAGDVSREGGDRSLLRIVALIAVALYLVATVIVVVLYLRHA